MLRDRQHNPRQRPRRVRQPNPCPQIIDHTNPTVGAFSMSQNQTPILAFASGKGGVGKTSLCLNVACQMAKAGKRVVVLDADLGLANVDVQLGLTPDKDLSHVLRGQAELKDILQKSDRGFYILPGRSGAEVQSLFDAFTRRDMLRQLREFAGSFDAVLIDVAAGVDAEVLNFANFADTTVLVTTPDPSSITDAYAVAKLLYKTYSRNNIQVVINQAGGVQEGKNTHEKLATAAERFLGINLPLLHIIPYDRNYAAAVKLQKLTSIAFPNTAASKALEELARKLLP